MRVGWITLIIGLGMTATYLLGRHPGHLEPQYVAADRGDVLDQLGKVGGHAGQHQPAVTESGRDRTMRRFYRIDLDGTFRHVVEEGGSWRLVEGDIFGSWSPGAALPGMPGRWLAPVLPSKIVAIGLNYKDHAAEQNKPVPVEPMMFLKPSTSVIGPGDAIRISFGMGQPAREEHRPRARGDAPGRGLVRGVRCLGRAPFHGLRNGKEEAARRRCGVRLRHR